MTRARSRKAITLVEMLIVLVVASSLIGILVSLLTRGSRLAQGETELLGLQVEAQRSLALFLRDLQQGMLVVVPQPGQTHPQAVVRDQRNRLIHYTLAEGPNPQAGGVIRRSELTPAGAQTTDVLQGVSRVTFTSVSDGGLRLHLVLQDRDRRFAFFTQVRMRNRDAASN